MLLSIGIIGNILVVVWRLAQKRDQRSSPLSILIIMLAVSDFFYCVHLLLLEGLVTESHLGQQKHWEQVSTRYVCNTSSVLSWVSCLTAQWATFNIAVYSFQVLNGWCSRCCCSLVRKRVVVTTIIYQVVLVVASILSPFLLFLYVDVPFLFQYESSWVDRSNVRYSSRAQITAIFGSCALVQSCGYFGYCINSTESVSHGNYTTVTNDLDGISCELDAGLNPFLGAAVASLCTLLTLSYVVLYLIVCLTVRRRASPRNLTRTSDIHKFQWRLSVIVLINIACWIPTTALHWSRMVGMQFVDIDSTESRQFNNTTAANVLLISISPAVNPLIYTLTGKNFLHSIRKFCRRMKCNISMRQNSSNYHDDHIRGVERCSCIPWVRCVHQIDEDNDTDPSDWNSNQSRLLPSTIESSRALVDFGAGARDTVIPAHKVFQRKDLIYDRRCDLIGRGGFADVYKAVLQGNTVVAFKIPFIGGPRFTDIEMNGIMKESSILLAIPSHKHIVKIFGVCIDSRHFGIVLEYIDGGDLSRLLSSHTFVPYMNNWKNKLDMTCQIADGMTHLHGLDPPIIHRDLKPNNILVKKSSAKYTCKISDFGLAKLRATTTTAACYTGDGSTLHAAGSLGYIAPERYGSVRLDMPALAKSDIYSFGVILFQFRERILPFGEENNAVVIALNIREGTPFKVPIKPCPHGYDELMRSCCSMQTDDRPAFADILTNLQAMLHDTAA
ncbi:uncharacterized protein LOC134198253 isoform X2 [Corticium candelabrum]|nr:uncharacterized protein LOC134198253 isoform X2 [Corticium candelabrum]